MKRFLKNNILLILSLVMVAALVGSTYAYLAATDSQIINKFKLAQIDTSVKEQVGDAGMKVVQIQNDDISSVYVRARVLVSGGDVGAYFDPSTGFITGEIPQPADNSIHVVYNSTDWGYSDGWFYYLHVLPGKSDTNPMPATEPLITKVIVGSLVQPPEDGSSKSFEVDVYEESVLTSATGDVDPSIAKATFEGKG